MLRQCVCLYDIYIATPILDQCFIFLILLEYDLLLMIGTCQKPSSQWTMRE